MNIIITFIYIIFFCTFLQLFFDARWYGKWSYHNDHRQIIITIILLSWILRNCSYRFRKVKCEKLWMPLQVQKDILGGEINIGGTQERMWIDPPKFLVLSGVHRGCPDNITITISVWNVKNAIRQFQKAWLELPLWVSTSAGLFTPIRSRIIMLPSVLPNWAHLTFVSDDI